jgi:Fe-S oxidoreductase
MLFNTTSFKHTNVSAYACHTCKAFSLKCWSPSDGGKYFMELTLHSHTHSEVNLA